MSTAGWLPAPADELFGAEATVEEAYEVLTVDVPPSSWLTALETARTALSCSYFDWLSAVDEPGTGLRVCAHVVALRPVRRLLLRTTVPHEAPALPSAVGVYAGAGWHERETHEMFGIVFEGHPGLDHLLLPETFEGHPLRKDFVLAARVAKAWPGAKEPGESDHGGPKRRQMLPPGVPDPNEWGPLKGRLPAAPARPARGAGRAAPGERPVRRTRTATEGSASQTPAPGETPGTAGPEAPARPRRTRSASEGSASRTAALGGDAAEGTQAPAPGPAGAPGSAGETAETAAEAPAGPHRTRSASEGSASRTAAPGGDAAEGDASQAAKTPGEASLAHEPGTAPAPARPRRARSASEGSATQRSQAPEPAPADAAEPDGTARPASPPTARRGSDAPWHHARPAFEEPEEKTGPRPETPRTPEADQEPEGAGEPAPPSPAPEPEPAPRPTTPDDPSDDPSGGPQ
ncbi:dehydrogenase [Streptomyces bungoensis]|uniref:Dehydrogenase n=1 Tax=Streptomyces bungoensis TaxID=285568 RepID=A0A117RDV6_9ACTN|nr:NADH-quinone oxidoreductase subunit C [Streptomyces bungoensis]KUN85346.1 dehydrogenase [Streptomyces bungoensis]